MFPTIDIERLHFASLPNTFINIDEQYEICPRVEKPELIGHFSVTGDRQYVKNSSCVRFWNPPHKFPLDLSEGYEKAVHHTESDFKEGLDHSLKFIYDNRWQFYVKSNANYMVLNTDVVCQRGLLTLLMMTPYEASEDWCIHAIQYRNTIYLWKPLTEKSKKKEFDASPRDQLMTSWGYKFEQYCLSNSLNEKPNTKEPVIECEEFNGVFKTRIGNFYLLYTAEIDGMYISSNVEKDNIDWERVEFVELKTRVKSMNQSQQYRFNSNKSISWWAQSFLVGIETIQVGLRSDDGMLLGIEKIRVEDLPKNKPWKTTKCVSSVVSILYGIRKTMRTVDSPDTTFAFYFNASTRQITFEKFEGKTAYSFLPRWFVDSLG